MLGRRQENARRILQQLLRSDAEDDVFALRGVNLRERDLEIRVERRAVEWIAVGLGKLSENRIDRHLAGAERVLVAADTDGLHSGGETGTHHASAAVAVLLHEFGHVFFVAASRQPLTRVIDVPTPDTLKETAARHRHELLLQLPNERKTGRKIVKHCDGISSGSYAA